MKLSIYSIRDAKSEAFGRPYFLPTAGVAIRTFTDEVNNSDNNNPLHYHNSDFALYELGCYDDSNAQFTLHEQPKLLIQADQVLNKT